MSLPLPPDFSGRPSRDNPIRAMAPSQLRPIASLHGRKLVVARHSGKTVVYEVQVAGKSHRLEIKQATGGWHCVLDGDEICVDAAQIDPDTFSLIIEGKSFEVRREPEGKLFIRGKR